MRIAIPRRGWIRYHKAMAAWTLLLAGVILAGLAVARADDGWSDLRPRSGPVFGPGSNEAGRELVVRSGKQVSLAHVLSDGGGYQWDIQSNGNIGQGTNYAFGSGLQLQVNGSQTPSSSSALASSDSREVQVGPGTNGPFRVWRRVRIYEDQALARWINIVENTSGSDQNVSLTVVSYFNYGLESVTFQDNAATFGAEHSSVIAHVRQGQNNPPSFHYLGAPEGAVRPSVHHQGNQLTVTYSMMVPAGQTAALVYFCSQDNNVTRLNGLLKDFRPEKYLRDLSPSARRAILNLPTGYLHTEISLDRKDGVDRVELKLGDPMLGSVRNTQYILDAPFGRITLPAQRVVGMLCHEEDLVQCVLTDGQVVAGRLPDQLLEFELSGGGLLRIPPARIGQWSYGITPARPDPLPFVGPYLVMRDGCRLLYRADTVPLEIQARNDLLTFAPRDLLAVQLESGPNGVHRVLTRNGSQMAGFLLPAEFSPDLALGGNLELSRNAIAQLEFAPDITRDETLTEVSLSNGDRIYGQLSQKIVQLQTPFGMLDLDTTSLHTLVFTPQHPGHVVLVKWDGSVLRGRLMHENLPFQLVPGPVTTLYPAQIQTIVRHQVLPPAQVLEQLANLVLKLGAESYQDRQEATDQLKSMGPGVVDTLVKYQQSAREPEVRLRLDTVIDSLRSQPTPSEMAQRVRTMLRR